MATAREPLLLPALGVKSSAGPSRPAGPQELFRVHLHAGQSKGEENESETWTEPLGQGPVPADGGGGVGAGG